MHCESREIVENLSDAEKNTEGTEGHPSRSSYIASVWKIGRNIGIPELNQKMSILRAITKICIQMSENVF